MRGNKYSNKTFIKVETVSAVKLLVVKIVDQVNINQYRTHSNIADGCFGENR